jgi:hypothetical protein
MKRIILIIVLLALFSIQQHSSAQSMPAKGWSEPVYHGLIFGKSTRAEVLQKFGKAKYTGGEADTGTPIVVFEVKDPVQGDLTVYFSKGLVEGMYLHPKNQLSVDDVIHLYGKDFKEVFYSSDECLDNGGTVPIYQNPRGDFKTMEYKKLGIIIEFHNFDPSDITFTDRPLGPDHSLCKAKSPKK